MFINLNLGNLFRVIQFDRSPFEVIAHLTDIQYSRNKAALGYHEAQLIIITFTRHFYSQPEAARGITSIPSALYCFSNLLRCAIFIRSQGITKSMGQIGLQRNWLRPRQGPSQATWSIIGRMHGRGLHSLPYKLYLSFTGLKSMCQTERVDIQLIFFFK